MEKVFVYIVSSLLWSLAYTLNVASSYFIYLQNKITDDQKEMDCTYHCKYVSRIPILVMDPSVAVCFLCRTRNDFDELCSTIATNLTRETQPLFDICEKRPSHWNPLNNDIDLQNTNIFTVSQSCTTPLGIRSQCISLYDCQQLVAAFSYRPIPTAVTSFLRQSHCGFVGEAPKVCCGPLPPSQNNENPPSPTNNNNVKTNNLSPDQIDPVNGIDSSPAPRDSCGVDTNGDRIYGGVDTEIDEFPWMALLGYRQRTGGLTYQCGGVLINNRYVVTAAHCITGAIETQIGRLDSIRLGEYDKRTEVDCVNSVCAEMQEIPVHIAVAHPGYSDNDKNRKDDIGIARLARRAHYSYYVQPICVVMNNERLNVGHEVYVVGWGKTLNGKSSDVKQKLNMPIFSKDECITKYKNLGAAITDKQICAGGGFHEDSCSGDSGGPLMRKRPEGTWETVGVVSFGRGCGAEGWPGIYTSVAHYIDWIESTMRSTNV